MPQLCIFPARALDVEGLKPGDLWVLAAIGKHTDATGAGCWANSKTLAQEAKLAQSTFFAAAERLLAAGLIERTSGKAEGRSSDYRVLLDAPKRGVSSPVDTRYPAQKIGVSSPVDTPTIKDPFKDTTTTGNSAELSTELSTTEWITEVQELNGRPSLAVFAWNGGPGCVVQIPATLNGLPPDDTADLWPLVTGVLQRFVRTPDHARLSALLSECGGALLGMHGEVRTLPEIITNLRDYLINPQQGDVSMRHLRAYLYRDPKVPDKRTLALGAGPQRTGPISTLAAGELVKKLRGLRVQVRDGIRAGHYMLPSDWRTKLPEHEARAIDAVGVDRVIDSEGEQRGFMLSQLAKALDAALAAATP